MSLTCHIDGSFTIGEERLDACLEAAYELDAMVGVLVQMVPLVDGTEVAHYAARGMAARIKTLSYVLLSGLNDKMVTTQDLMNEVLAAR